MNHIVELFRGLAVEEEGAQIVEYALIIAAVSLALIGLLITLAADDGQFTAFVTRVGTCLSGGACVPAE